MVLLYLGFSLASKVFLKTWNVFSAVVVLTEEERKWFYSEENPWVAAERSDISLLGTSRLQLEEGEIDVIGYGCSSIFCERGSQVSGNESDVDGASLAADEDVEYMYAGDDQLDGSWDSLASGFMRAR